MDSSVRRLVRYYVGPQPSCTSEYEDRVSSEARTSAGETALALYPSRVPVVIEPAFATTAAISKNKYLVPRDIRVADILDIIRQRLSVDRTQSLFVFVEGRIPTPTTTIGELHSAFAHDDRLLYMRYDMENVFG